MQVLGVIVPYCRTTSNLALSCTDIHNWLSNNGFPVKTDKADICSRPSLPRHEICAQAAFEGNLNLLKWARDVGCEWDEWTCIYAANEGHKDVFKWAKENNASWNIWTYMSMRLLIKLFKL